ncbi:A/G-specific adenine glycosylase [Sphingobacterium hungaricum]
MGFSSKLISWYAKNGRELPWRNTTNPYIIWLSEIILQQTRIEQGTPYFHNFLENFPTIEDFANADEGELLKLWQGLGYYSRARNMHKAARQIQADFDGKFPTKYEEVIKLTGIGEYTAAAIASFSSNAAYAVLDGNVFRVLSRYFAIDTPINSTAGKKQFSEIANELLDKKHPGTYNQAIMDFGAMQCKPKNPLCEECIFRMDCRAFQTNSAQSYPVKLKKKPSRNRFFAYFIVEEDGQLLMAKRNDSDIWANMYEFPMIETEEELSISALVEHNEFKFNFPSAILEQLNGTVKQVLSHQNIYAKFYRITNPENNVLKNSSWAFYNSENLDKLAMHKLMFTFLETFKKLP